MARSREKAVSTGQPWERREGETEKAHEAFQLYRDLGTERSMEKVGERLGKSLALMERWSARHDWGERVLAWDRHWQAAKEAAAIETAVEMGRRHAAMLAEVGAAMVAPVKALLARIEERRAAGEDPFEDWDDRELMRAAEVFARVLPSLVQADRLVAGLSTQNVGGHSGGPVEVDLRDMREWPRARLEGYLVGLRDGAAWTEEASANGHGDDVPALPERT